MTKPDRLRGSSTKAAVEMALLVDVTLVLALLRSAIPFLSPIVQVFAAIPMAIGTARHGVRPSLVGALMLAVIVSSFLGVISGVWSLFYALAGIVIGETTRRGGSLWSITWRAALGYTLLFASTVMLIAQMLGLNPKALVDRFTEAMAEAQRFTEFLGPLGSPATLPAGRESVLAVIGVAFFVICFLYTLGTSTIVSKILQRLD